MKSDSIKVFISYSHDSEEHKQWVKRLASNLRSHGVDVILDQFHARIGGDLRFFMEDGLCESKLVLCICSEKYVLKVDNGEGGAGYESTIISYDLISNSKTDYIIPVIRNNTTKNKVPKFLYNKQYLDFSNDNDYFVKYEELLRRIYNEDQNNIPPLGENPFKKDLAQQIIEKTNIEKIK